MSEGWKLIRRDLDLEDPVVASQYLGCDHKLSIRDAPPGANPFDHPACKDTGVKEGMICYRCIEYDMSSILESRVERYCELANVDENKLHHANTSFHGEEPHTGEAGGNLQPIASRVLMKILYAARMARYDC